MKLLAAIVLCLILGYQLGRWGPQAQVVKQKAEIERLRAEVKRGGRNNMRGVASLLNIAAESETGQAEQTEPPEPNPPPVTNELATVSTNASTTNTVLTAEERRRLRRMHKGETEVERRERMADRIAKAKEAWDTRSKIAREGFLQRVRAKPAEQQHFDNVVTTMNLHVKSLIDEWSAEMDQYEEIYHEDGVRLFEDILGVVVANYDSLDDGMPQGWRKKAGKNFKLFDFIDPSVGEAMIKLEGKGADF